MAPYDPYVMPTIAHPDEPDRQIEVEVVDRESHRGAESVQVQATSDEITLTDGFGGDPWLPADEVENTVVAEADA